MGADPERDDRSDRALGERHLGAALIGLAILVFWSIRLVLARWSG